MRLFVVADYACREVHHPKGAVLEVPGDVAAWLMADAPGCFSLTPPVEEKEIAAPPADKMLRKARSK